MRYVHLIVFCIFISCNIEVNTVDPQISPNISSSKENGFFIKSFQWDKPEGDCNLKEAWLEYTWKNSIKNSIKNSKVLKEKLGGVQLVLTLDKKSLPVDPNSYITNWVLQDSSGNILGSGKNAYVLDINERNMPDKIKIWLKEAKGEKKTICILELKQAL